jgi:hypothetical protein
LIEGKIIRMAFVRYHNGLSFLPYKVPNRNRLGAATNRPTLIKLLLLQEFLVGWQY